MHIYIVFVGILHVAFTILEMYPWANPFLLQAITKSLPKATGVDTKFSPEQLKIVATIVHNAGVYNAILAMGLFWVAYRGPQADEFTLMLFIGVAVAGGFGTATVKSVLTALQGLLGIGGAVALWSHFAN